MCIDAQKMAICTKNVNTRSTFCIKSGSLQITYCRKYIIDTYTENSYNDINYFSENIYLYIDTVTTKRGYQILSIRLMVIDQEV